MKCAALGSGRSECHWRPMWEIWETVMNYQLDLGAWNSVFAVPCVLVDKYLKLAGKEQLQAILWILRRAGNPFSDEELSTSLGMSLDSAQDAVAYWEDCGLLGRKDGQLIPEQEPATQLPAPSVSSAPAGNAAPAVEDGKPLPPKRRQARPDGLHIAARINESEDVRFMMQEAETILGKTISPALSSVLIASHDDYGLPAEILLMLLNYAKSVGKTGTSYIDSVARDWAESNIFTMDAAEQKLQELSERRQAWKKVESVAGLSHRAPTKKEEDAVYRWVCEWNFSPEMLSGAYERCAENTGKFNIRYMDKILERWHIAGIKNMAQAEADEQKQKAKNTSEKSYDIEELERMSFFNPLDE